MNLAASATVSGGSSNSYVSGALQKTFSPGTNQSFTFPIGDTSVYAPVAITAMNLGTGSAGTLNVSTTAGDHTGLVAAGLDVAQGVNRYWTLSNGAGFAPATFNATFGFAASDVDAAASPSTFVVRRYSGGNWAAAATGVRTATSVQATGLNAVGDFAVGENMIDHYAVTAATPQTAGIAFGTTVTAQDIFNQIVAADSTSVVTVNGSGAVQFDANGDGTFGDNTKTLSNGTFTITTRDGVAETVALTAVDAALRRGTLADLVINVGPASKLILVTQPSTVATAGQPFAQQPVVLIADAFNNVRSNDTLTVTATRNSGGGSLLGTTNIAAVNGVATYSNLAHPVATNITIRFTSGALAAATSGPVTISPGVFSRLLALLPGESSAPGTTTGRSGIPSATVGANTAVRVLATDGWFNRVTTATDTVSVTTSDANAALPANAALVNGTNTLNFVFKTSGSRVVTVADVTDGAKLASTNTVTVAAGPFAKLQLLVPGESAAAGTPAGKSGTPRAQVQGVAFNVTVNSADANWNLVTTNDTVRITSSDPIASLPATPALSSWNQKLVGDLENARLLHRYRFRRYACRGRCQHQSSHSRWFRRPGFVGNSPRGDS